jgi:hypothetical protein
LGRGDDGGYPLTLQVSVCLHSVSQGEQQLSKKGRGLCMLESDGGGR